MRQVIYIERLLDSTLVVMDVQTAALYLLDDEECVQENDNKFYVDTCYLNREYNLRANYIRS